MSIVHQFGTVDDNEDPMTDSELAESLDKAEKDAAETSAANVETLYAEMREDLGTPAITETELVLPISGRKNFELIFNTEIPYDRLRVWIKLSRPKNPKSTEEDMDMRRFSLMVLVSKHVGIKYKGVRMTDDNGRDLKFDSPEMLRLTKQLEKVGVITWLFGQNNDGEIMRAASKITEAAGYGDLDYGDVENEEDDPLA